MNVSDLLGSLRRHWIIAVAVFLLGVIIAAGFALTRSEPTAKRAYEASSRYRVPADDPTTGKSTTAAVPDILRNSSLTLALDNQTIARAQANSNVSNPEQVTYKATLSPEGDVVTLSTTARTAKRADKSLIAYNNAFTDARSNAVVTDATREQRGITARITSLDQRLNTISRQLSRDVEPLPPLVLVNQNGQVSSSNGTGGPPVLDLPDDLSQRGRALAYERNSLYSEQVRLESAYGALSVQIVTPDPYASLIALNKAGRITPTPPRVVLPTLAILLAGLVLGLAAALLTDYFDSTIHTAGAASTALDALVLAKIPARGRFEDRFADPATGSERSAAYRGLAATSISTDRMPKALLITSPRGKGHDSVAYNYAQGLTSLGMKVVLIASQPDQGWFLEPQGHDGPNLATLPELLDLAHRGALGGTLMTRVAVSAAAPNLAIVTPGTGDAHVALDGLGPLLAAFEAEGIDVVLLAGPKMLDDADATIFAYTIRNVLWTIETHAVKEKDARAAADQLAITGGETFGVALIGEEI